MDSLIWSKSQDPFCVILYLTEGFCEEHVHLNNTDHLSFLPEVIFCVEYFGFLLVL